jgi:hypothetical protein
MEGHTYETIMDWIPKVMDRLMSIEEMIYVTNRPHLTVETRADGSVYESVDEEPEFFSPRNDANSEAARKRFRPDVVTASAFGESTQATRSSPPRVERPTTPVGLPILGTVKTRMTWNKLQVADLRTAYQRFGSQWERMRKEYPSLREFTGVQIKDKYRATFGNRASTSPRS